MKKAPKSNIKETDLFAPIQAFWLDRGYVVNAEVKGFDITLTKDNRLTIIETKLHFNTTLLYQAIEAQKVADFVYIAIPAQPYKKLAKITHIAKSLNLGLITISDAKWVNIVLGQEDAYINAPTSRKNTKKQKRVKAEIENRKVDTNIGGSRGVKLITAYKEKSIHIALALQHLHANGTETISPAQLIKQYNCPPNTRAIMYENAQGWFARKGKAQYCLDKKGTKALSLPEYTKVVDYYQRIVNEYANKEEKE